MSVDRIGAARTLAAGIGILGAGMLLLARVPSDASYLVDLLPAYSIVGLGLGFAEVSIQIAAFAGIEPDEAGLAGGSVETSREMGGAIGLAIVASIALGAADGMTETFHVAALSSAILAAACAAVALILMAPTERRAQLTTPSAESSW